MRLVHEVRREGAQGDADQFRVAGEFEGDFAEGAIDEEELQKRGALGGIARDDGGLAEPLEIGAHEDLSNVCHPDGGPRSQHGAISFHLAMERGLSGEIEGAEERGDIDEWRTLQGPFPQRAARVALEVDHDESLSGI